MKKYIIAILVLCIGLTSVLSMDKQNRRSRSFPGRMSCLDHIDLDIEDGSVMIYPDYDKYDDDDRHRRRRRDRDEDCVEITDTYKLYINGRRVKTTEEQEELLAQYHDQVYDIVDEAKRIGWEGAKIGLEGAKLGVKAVAGVVKLLLPGYSSDDLERDMEKEAEKIELKAERLEEEAEKIEVLVDDLEDMHYGLRDHIPELDKLRWF